MSDSKEQFEYTIAICNYEMADTIQESLRSILTQVDSRYEVLVVDDGSTDGSVRILKNLEYEHDNFRLYKGDNNNLAEARNCSFEQANGKYIIESIDVDDRYRPVIPDFVRIFHALEDAGLGKFYLWGHGINMAPRELLLEYPYRSLGYGEDKDFWRRLAADDKLLLIDHASPRESIGYDRGRRGMLKIWFESSVVEFQTGITASSFVSYNLKQLLVAETVTRREAVFNLLSLPVTYLISTQKPQYPPVPGFERFGALKEHIQSRQQTLSELEKKHGFKLDREEFSDAGYNTFVAYGGT